MKGRPATKDSQAHGLIAAIAGALRGRRLLPTSFTLGSPPTPKSELHKELSFAKHSLLVRFSGFRFVLLERRCCRRNTFATSTRMLAWPSSASKALRCSPLSPHVEVIVAVSLFMLDTLSGQHSLLSGQHDRTVVLRMQ